MVNQFLRALALNSFFAINAVPYRLVVANALAAWTGLSKRIICQSVDRRWPTCGSGKASPTDFRLTWGICA